MTDILLGILGLVVIIGVPVALLVALVSSRRKREGSTLETVCAQCETVGDSKVRMPGSFVVELALYLLWILPGVIYTVWRYTNTERACTACGAKTLLPVDSPAGQRIINSAATTSVPLPPPVWSSPVSGSN